MPDLTELLKQAIAPFIAASLALWMYLKDRPQRESKVKSDEMSRFKILLDEIQEERDNLKKDRESLKEELEKSREARKNQDKRIRLLELEHENDVKVLEQEREKFKIREASLQAVIAELRDQIEELRNQINGVEEKAEEVKKHTDELGNKFDKKK